MFSPLFIVCICEALHFVHILRQQAPLYRGTIPQSLRRTQQTPHAKEMFR